MALSKTKTTKTTSKKKQVPVIPLDVEPEYRFIKGQGWIPSFEKYPFITKRIGQYIVTGTTRLPEQGDYYFEQYINTGSKETPEKLIMEAMEDEYWRHILSTCEPELLARHFAKWTGGATRNSPRYKYVVLTFTKV